MLQFAGGLAYEVAHELRDTHLVSDGEAFPRLVFSGGDGDNDFHTLDQSRGRLRH